METQSSSEGAEVHLSGSCHCGGVRWEARARLAADGRLSVQSCNCSICAKKGFLHLIVPRTAFSLLSPSSLDELGLYQFGTGVARHLFCRTCGICSFYVPRSNPNGLSLNVRCLDGDSVPALNVEAFDGKSNWDADAAKIKHLA